MSMKRNVNLVVALLVSIGAWHSLNINNVPGPKSITASALNETISPPFDMNEYELLKQVHQANEPAAAAGRWVNKPKNSIVYTEEHLQCLDMERQGNCHDPEDSLRNGDPAKLSRSSAIQSKAILNSPGILNASDPWVWESERPYYQVIQYDQDYPDQYKHRIRKLLTNRTIHLVGDSLTRQWAQVMKCELIHIHDFSQEEVDRILRVVIEHKGLSIAWIGQNATSSRDFFVINFGHHIGRTKLRDKWANTYKATLDKLQDAEFGPVPDHHIFFRSTSVRHFLAGAGDWDTETSMAGSAEPNMHAKWSMYGGNHPDLPEQNLLAFELLAGEQRRRNFQILDTSPMMLARADSSFDGSHFCLPGPMQFWSQMLYNRIEQDQGLKYR